MTSSTSYSDRAIVAVAALVLSLMPGCSRIASSRQVGVLNGHNVFKVAVLPIANLTDTSVPLDQLRRQIITTLQNYGVSVLDDDTLARFMAEHRVRYVGGVSDTTTAALADETETTGVLVSSVDVYSETSPPRVAMTMRLVSADKRASIRWMDGMVLAGNEAPGLLALGVVADPVILRDRVIDALIGSLVRYLERAALSDEEALEEEHVSRDRSGQGAVGECWRGALLAQTRKTLRPKSVHCREQTTGRPSRGRFSPRIAYRSPEFPARSSYRVAVIPFANDSDYEHAGEILLLELSRQLALQPGVAVIEPGVVRETLLKRRVIMHDGISLEDAELVFADLAPDLILTGRILDYDDHDGSLGAPWVDFSVLAIDANRKTVVWSSRSHGKGDDGVYFFNRGRVYTASAMAKQMVRAVAEQMLYEGEPR